VLPDKGRVVVEGVNLIKRHTKANPQRRSRAASSSARPRSTPRTCMLVDPDSSKPTRVGHKTLENKTRVRVARRSGSVLDK
jgi:large subunit ribosomal protein L24